jgi:hypothetical protein
VICRSLEVDCALDPYVVLVRNQSKRLRIGNILKTETGVAVIIMVNQLIHLFS